MTFDNIEIIKYFDTRQNMDDYIEEIKEYRIEKPTAVVYSNNEDDVVYCNKYNAYFIISDENFDGSLIDGKHLISKG